MKASSIGTRLAAGAVAAILLQGALWAPDTAFASSASRALESAGLTGAVSASASNSASSGATNGVIQQAIHTISPSVVAIIGRPTSDEEDDDAYRYGSNRFNLAHGTGVVVRQDGQIVTNAHVVSDMEQLVVVTADGKQYAGKVTHLDEESDLALVKIEATGLTPAVFADTAATQVGDTVIAIGTPISFTLRNSATVGVISGLDRSVNSTYRLLQTDAAINPGNSGGALVNTKGEVVGINSLKVASYGVESLGFAIPSDTVQYVLSHFQKYGKVRRPATGLELEESWAALVGIPSEEPMTVSFVEDESPAAKAGIKSGDKLLAVDGHSVKNLVEFNELLKRYLPGDSASFQVQSNGSTLAMTLVFNELETIGSGAQTDGSGKDTDFDTDAGKIRIGDSRYNWSIKYPSGLDLIFQSDNGSFVAFEDAKGEYGLRIRVKKKDHEMSMNYLLRTLVDSDTFMDTTDLDRRIVESANGTYARVIAKVEDSYQEARIYDHDGYLYELTLGIASDKDYNNKTKRKGYTDLLDSLRFEADHLDRGLKDLAADSKEGARRSTHEVYGYSFTLPSDWQELGSGYYVNESSMDSSAAVEFASMAKGDTLEAWAKRIIERQTSQYADGYIRSGELEEVKLDGQPALAWSVETSMGDEWQKTRMFFAESGGYKVRISVEVPESLAAAKADAIVAKFRDSFEWGTDKRDGSLGYIADEADLIDPDNRIEYKNSLFGYRLEAPETWEEERYPRMDEAEEEDADVPVGEQRFSFLGGSLSIQANNRSTYEEIVKLLQKQHKEAQENDSDYQLETADEEWFGTTAKVFRLHYSVHKVAYTQNQYVFTVNGTTYIVTERLNDAVRTERNVTDLQEALESLHVEDK